MSKYIIAIMGAIIAYLGISYVVHVQSINTLSNKVADITKERDRALEVAENNKRNLDLYIDSCEATLATVNAQAEKDRALYKAKEATLEKLSTVKPTKATSEVKNASKGSTGASVFGLDPEYVRLLNAAYCDGNQDDPYCATEGAGDSLPASNKSGNK